MPRDPYTGQSHDLGPLFARSVAPDFDGAGYERRLDHARLTKQIADVYRVLRGGGWLTLAEIAAKAGCGEASASAQLRNLRKPRFGGHTIERKRRCVYGGVPGVWVYRLAVPEQAREEDES